MSNLIEGILSHIANQYEWNCIPDGGMPMDVHPAPIVGASAICAGPEGGVG
jgi:hypothetical protein